MKGSLSNSKHIVQVVYTGDIFHDGWRERAVPPELINFLIQEMPKGYAVPGQHDLPYHRYEDKHKSAYWTLVEAKVLSDLEPGKSSTPNYEVGFDVTLMGFPWGAKQRHCPTGYEDRDLRVAVVHDYCWCHGHCYPNAPTDKNVLNHAERLKGFNIALFGDNHKPFTSVPDRAADGPTICNIGSFLKRTADEKGEVTRVALVTKKGRIIHYALPCKPDQWDQGHTKKLEGKQSDVFKKLADKIDQLSAVSADLKDVCAQVMRETKADKETVAEVLRVIDQARAKGGP